MTAQHLNVVTVLHMHKDCTDAIDLHAALREFETANDTLKSLFVWIVVQIDYKLLSVLIILY